MKTSIIGAGLIGARRANSALDYGDEVVSIFDSNTEKAAELANNINSATASSPEEAIDSADIVVVSTPNKFLLPTAKAALEAGKHTLIEKPMCRNFQEASELADLQKQNPSIKLKVGFNHRYHPAIAKAHDIVACEEIGKPIYVRGIYGHGGRPGYEKEWRGDRDLAGGGELTDQGVHLLDLICWFLSCPNWTFAQRRTCVWPLDDLEDNGFFMLGWNNGTLAQLHTSWTQWKNRFSFEVFCTNGAIAVEGLGGSYGEETLTITKRKPEGGVPDIESMSFPGEDLSWKLEWIDFRKAIDANTSPMGSANEGLDVMKALDAIYKSCDSNAKVEINS